MRNASLLSLVFGCVLSLSGLGCGGTVTGGGSGGSGGSGAGGSGGDTGTGGSNTGGSDTGGTGGMGGQGGSTATGGMSLTSPEIFEGEMIPYAYTCQAKNVSPELNWTPGPAGTLSYSVIFKDDTTDLIHWAIWNIPPDMMGLPTFVEFNQFPSNVPGAQQALAIDQVKYGWSGPCPPNGETHNYTFTVYALDVATLPLAGIATKESAEELSVEHKLDLGTLSATSTIAQ